VRLRGNRERHPTLRRRPQGLAVRRQPAGAETSALLYSLVETAKANGLEPHAYLSYLFEHVPSAKTPDAVAALLPHKLTLDDIKPKAAIL
jgi:transposase